MPSWWTNPFYHYETILFFPGYMQSWLGLNLLSCFLFSVPSTCYLLSLFFSLFLPSLGEGKNAGSPKHNRNTATLQCSAKLLKSRLGRYQNNYWARGKVPSTSFSASALSCLQMAGTNWSWLLKAALAVQYVVPRS